MSSVQIILVALTMSCVAFALCFGVARRLNNYGIVDIVWSYASAAVAIFYALVGHGWGARRALLAGIVTLWSIRLGTHLLVRIARHHPVEDARYAELRKTWAGHFSSRMFGFFQLQALSVLVLSAGFFPSMNNTRAALHPLEYAGVALWFLAFVGEAVADAQLAGFKAVAANRDRVCDVGLWRYSRHPNYFCEWLIWVGYFVFALASPWGWIGVVGPAAILYLLLCVTGVPMAEEQSVRSKGDAYRAYQRRTSAFFPRRPRAG